MAMTEEEARQRARDTGGTVGWSGGTWYVIPSGTQLPPDIPGTVTPPTAPPMPERQPYMPPTPSAPLAGDRAPSPTFTPQQYTPPSPVTNWIDQYQPIMTGAGQIGTTPERNVPAYPPPPTQPYQAEPVGGGLRMPWQTPPGVGFIAPWTEQARYQDPTLGYQYIQTGGAPEQIAAGAQYGQLPPAMGGGAITRGPWMSPQDIPPELREQYGWEWFTYTDPTLGDMPMVRLKALPTMTPFQEWQTQQMQQEQVLPGAGVPIPGGAREGQIITRSDGSTFMWMRGPQGYPMPREISPPTEQPGVTRMTPYQQAGIDIRQQEMAAEEAWRQAQLEAEMQMQQAQLGWQQQQFQQQQQWAQQQWQQQLAFQEQARTAALAAQPQSWLQYHALQGTEPQVQPWMLPLMAQQYPELQAGMPIPGWMGETAMGQPMTTLPELLRPSAQYQARMGPQSWAQYLGYQQARTGALPEQANWLQRQYAPGGWGGGLTYTR